MENKMKQTKLTLGEQIEEDLYNPSDSQDYDDTKEKKGEEGDDDNEFF